MPEETRTDNIEKLLSNKKSLEARKQAFIADLLKQRVATIKTFDERLAKLAPAAFAEGTDRDQEQPVRWYDGECGFGS